MPELNLTSIVLDCADADELGDFYHRLLGWPFKANEPQWVQVRAPDGRLTLSFAAEPTYVPPTWPTQPGGQQMMMHLDILVDDLHAAGARAVELGARLAPFQPQDGVRTYFDPAGHPFCLYLPGW
jgi:catechol 2,3-dioxygenase-like lactoylglutathione lyase family enzyme